MKPEISIVYAHRNRDTDRIRQSFVSLKKQKTQNYEVVFVDFGSEAKLVEQLESLAGEFNFVSFYHLPVSQVLWNKSKALNYGIQKAEGKFVFIADIDLIFHPDTTVLWTQIKNAGRFQLFKLGYLNKQESGKLFNSYEFKDLKPNRFGEVNGMILTSRESLLQVNGLDEFFHFYGAEDEDLFARLENAGLKREERGEKYFYHNWHQSFSGSENKLLTNNPRLKNIMRINQRHFQRNRDRGIVQPLKQQGMGNFVPVEKSNLLQSPDIQITIPNILAQVEHFLREEISTYKGKVVQVKFFEDEYYQSFKYKIKARLGKQTQPYCTMKEVNDMVLKEILFNYRNHNYSFLVANDLKSIQFIIKI